MRHAFFPMMLIMLVASVATALPLEVDSGEVLRLGDMVQHVDGKIHGDTAEDAAIEALKPPADDNDKWFISVITTRSCAGCIKLKQDWSSDPWLLALANPEDSKQSWSHYTVYDAADRSQSWRWKNIKIVSYPTILVQPPRNEKYGKSSTVVYQGTYGGDPRQLAADISNAIKQYVGKLNTGYTNQDVAPPWTPAPKEDRLLPFRPNDNGGRLIPPLVPDEVAIEVSFPWKAILTLLAGGFSIPAIIGIVIWLLYTIRAGRKEAEKPLLLNDDVFNRLIDILERFDGNPDEQPRTPQPKRNTRR